VIDRQTTTFEAAYQLNTLFLGQFIPDDTDDSLNGALRFLFEYYGINDL